MIETFPAFSPSTVDAGFTPDDEDTRELYREVRAFARQGQPIVIFGPTGAGKEFLARYYYNTLIETEFYQQNKEKWPERFREIKKQYSTFYSGKSLDIFLNSIRAGVFQAINSATIYPNLAESILFGHEEGSFTGATMAHPGLLESIKYGVLFMDEIGDLPKDLQVKLLRAVDAETTQGRRIAGKMDYSLRDLIIICATNQPGDQIRKDFYYRIGMEVNLKGIDERPKDLLKSIPHFIRRAVGKRKDYAAVINMFGIKGMRDIGKIADTEEVNRFAQEMTHLIADEVLMRKWPGNFRALRNTLEASIFRIENVYKINDFSREFRNHLHYYISQYSTSTTKLPIINKELQTDSVFPSPFPKMDTNILKEIDQGNLFPNVNNYEKKVLSVFLSTTHEKGFSRKDLEQHYRKYSNIRHTSDAHIRGRINSLLHLSILIRTGNGKGTRYFLAQPFLEKVNENNEDIFALPAVRDSWICRHDEIDVLAKVLRTSERVYIQSPHGYGKSSFIAMLCEAKKSRYNFYYYPLGEKGITKLFNDIIKKLRSEEPGLSPDIIIEDPVIHIQPFLSRIFKSRGGVKPVLILDHANWISDPDETATIVDLARNWRDIILVLAGDKMDNAFQKDFFEFILGPWGREA